MQSHMTHNFSQIPRADIPRSSFDRSQGYKTTFDVDYLIPVFIDEVLPGDTFNLKMHAFGRLATPLKPFMDNMFLDSFFFYCPNRLLQDNWQKLNGQQENPGDSTDYLTSQILSPVGGFIPNTTGTPTAAELASALSDYLGLPTRVPAVYSFLAYWHLMYNLTWNQWFRDENLQNSVPVPKGDGPHLYTDFQLLKRGKRHDYFTSCLPWPQKGPSVPLPLTGNAPVKGIGWTGASGGTWGVTSGSIRTSGPTLTTAGAGAGDAWATTSNQTWVAKQSAVNTQYPDIYADLSAVTAATINQLRQSFQIQKLYERDARGGTRYPEILKSHFGVTSPDGRLQRVEYLGGGSTPLNVNPIAQTSAQTGQPTPQGNLAAIGTMSMHNNGFTKSFTEHGVVMGLVCVRADLTYQNGLPRMFSRRTRFDFYWPALSHIGEQAVLNKEIYLDGSANDALTFGYQERWAEYRYKPSQITGKFRSNDPQPLDFWHLAQKFTALPALNAAFIQQSTPVDRVVAVPSEPDFLFDAYFDYVCARPMPTYSVPGLIDHF